MNYIVLIKQVPDIKNIPKEAWDWEKGTLKRGLLDNVCNELDKQALTFALRMTEQRKGKTVSLTMGPPFAEEVLRYSLSIGIDVGVLLTDRKLGGADTAATAYPLAQAIRKIEKEIFNGSRDYIVVSGMQSIDGDTAGSYFLQSIKMLLDSPGITTGDWSGEALGYTGSVNIINCPS